MQLVKGSDLVGLFSGMSDLHLITEAAHIEQLGCHCLRGRLGKGHAKYCPLEIAAAMLKRIADRGERK